MKQSLDKSYIRILFLEGVSKLAVDYLQQQGYNNIDYRNEALDEEELGEIIGNYHLIGIRSRTQITPAVLAKADKLIAIGCFCIGTNQVHLAAAASNGIPVFNAPFSNTRSVAELTIASIIHLMRGIPAKNLAAHRGEWQKTAVNSFEVRSKKLGIIGYGNIGSQLSILASALGMHVYYYDIEKKLPHGNARQVDSLEELLQLVDVVSLHVPETAETKNMINATTLAMMKKGSFLINYARGSMVDITDLQQALKNKHIIGAALDVFPQEPTSKEEEFVSPLRGMDNVLISPHVGGSTLEAQVNIGKEVAEKLAKYSDNGSTKSAVNFPECNLPLHENSHRILNIHRNKPGIMQAINSIFAEQEINVKAQYLQTNNEIGYVVIDIADDFANPKEINQQLMEVPGVIKSRFLY